MLTIYHPLSPAPVFPTQVREPHTMVSKAQREKVPAETPESPSGSPRCNQIFQSRAVQTQAPRGPHLCTVPASLTNN